MTMQCKCGRESRRHEKKTPEGIFKKYFRIECACGIATPWACSLEGEEKPVDEYLKEEWEKIQKDLSANYANGREKSEVNQ